MRLRRYRDCARLLDRYNRHFEDAVGAGRLEGVMIHRALRDPAWYVDICHMTPEGIAQLAEAFLPAVSIAIERRAGSAAVPARP